MKTLSQEIKSNMLLLLKMLIKLWMTIMTDFIRNQKPNVFLTKFLWKHNSDKFSKIFWNIKKLWKTM